VHHVTFITGVLSRSSEFLIAPDFPEHLLSNYDKLFYLPGIIWTKGFEKRNGFGDLQGFFKVLSSSSFAWRLPCDNGYGIPHYQYAVQPNNEPHEVRTGNSSP
jgi:hypothetical protein